MDRANPYSSLYNVDTKRSFYRGNTHANMDRILDYGDLEDQSQDKEDPINIRECDGQHETTVPATSERRKRQRETIQDGSHRDIGLPKTLPKPFPNNGGLFTFPQLKRVRREGDNAVMGEANGIEFDIEKEDFGNDYFDIDTEPDTNSSAKYQEAKRGRNRGRFKSMFNIKSEINDTHCREFSRGGECTRKGKCKYVHDDRIRERRFWEMGIYDSPEDWKGERKDPEFAVLVSGYGPLRENIECRKRVVTKFIFLDPVLYEWSSGFKPAERQSIMDRHEYLPAEFVRISFQRSQDVRKAIVEVNRKTNVGWKGRPLLVERYHPPYMTPKTAIIERIQDVQSIHSQVPQLSLSEGALLAKQEENKDDGMNGLLIKASSFAIAMPGLIAVPGDEIQQETEYSKKDFDEESVKSCVSEALSDVTLAGDETNLAVQTSATREETVIDGQMQRDQSVIKEEEELLAETGAWSERPMSQ